MIYHKSIGELDSESNSINEKTDYITGCCLVISIDNIDKLNGFDEQFNMYAEDVDLCLRAKNKNIDCMYLPNSKIWHKVSSSTGGRFSLKKYIKKIQSIKRLIKIHEPQLNPNLAIAYARKGSIYYRLGDISQATVNWNIALMLDPEYNEVRTVLMNLKDG